MKKKISRFWGTLLFFCFSGSGVYALEFEHSCLNESHEDYVQYKDKKPIRFRFSENCISDVLSSGTKNDVRSIAIDAYWPGILSRIPDKTQARSGNKKTNFTEISIQIRYSVRPDLQIARPIKNLTSERFDLVRSDGNYKYYKRVSDKEKGHYPEGSGYTLAYKGRTDFYMFCSKDTCSIEGIVDDIFYRAFMGLNESSDWLAIHNEISTFIRKSRAN